MCLSTHQKADLISFRSYILTLASLTHFVALRPDRTPTVQSIHNMSRTRAGLQSAVTTKPYVEMSHMSNQWKAEFVDDIFYMQIFWEGHGKNSPRTYFIQEGMIY
jgi:hypothetical protein